MSRHREYTNADLLGERVEQPQIDLDRLADKLVERILPALLQALSVAKSAKRNSAPVADVAEPEQKPVMAPAARTAKVRRFLERKGLV